jgi:chromosome segregation ATPase
MELEKYQWEILTGRLADVERMIADTLAELKRLKTEEPAAEDKITATQETLETLQADRDAIRQQLNHIH